MGTELKELLNKRTKKEIVSKESLDFSNEIYNGEKGDYLKQKSYEMVIIAVKGALALGKLFEEVYQELGKENGEGIYIEWLKSNNYNRITAWRYRQKYNLYLEVNERGKELVALLPFDVISNICSQSEENKAAIIDLMNNGASKNDIKDLLIPQIEEKKSKEKNIKFELSELNFLKSEIENKYENLPEKNQEKLKKLLLEIKNLLK